MSTLKNNNNLKINNENNNRSMDQSPIENHLNSDNAFSDTGLENAEKLEEALNRDNS